MVKISKFTWAIILGVLIVGLLAYIDITERFETFLPFRNIAIGLIVIVPICYYFFYRKDKSETLALFLVPFILFWFGLKDILYYWFQGLKLPELLPHLDSHFIIGSVSEFFGYSQVTGSSLLLTSLLGIGITYFVVKYLKEKL